jgi:isochorismate synthase
MSVETYGYDSGKRREMSISNDRVPLSDLQAGLLHANLPFVSYRLPGKTAPVTLFGPGKYEKLTAIAEIFERKDGFVLAPFEEHGTILWLSTGIRVEGFEADAALAVNLPSVVTRMSRAPVYTPGKEEYVGQVTNALQHIKSGEAGKIVLSRRLVHVWPDAATHSGRLFRYLCELYPGAFVYLINLPGEGLWAGASPELLMKRENDLITTVSLSATRSRSELSAQWGIKETNEHLWVSRFIASQLELTGCREIVAGPMHTAGAGNVEHLQTVFNARCSSAIVAPLIYALHPTPAVCGWPVSRAYDILRKIENYDRSYYTGFIGPVGNRDDFSLFVNLRCMHIRKDDCVIYVGGGITIESDPESEWNETSMKSLTMLGAIEKLSNFAV